jgi:hypothetical protein
MPTAKKATLGSKSLTTVERTKIYLEQLKEAGGKRSSYNFKPEVVAAINTLKEHRPFDSETIIVGEAIIEAAKKLKKKK